MRVLLTGCAGFIGSAVARSLAEQDHEIVGIDDLGSPGYDPRLKRWRLARLEGMEGFEFVHGNVLDRSWEDSFTGAADAVIHLAARAGVRQSIDDPTGFNRTNVDGALNLFRFAVERSIPKLVLASTSSVYGGSDRMPFREEDPADRPLSPYASSKRAAELLAHVHHHNFGLDVSVVRYFTVYGPAGRPDMSIFRFIRWIDEGAPLVIFGDGTQQRDFTYVEDIAAGTIAALRPAGFRIYNLGNDRPVRLDRVITLIEEEVGRRATLEHHPAHPADVSATWASIDRARDELGWSPHVSVEEGIRRTVAWYRDQRDLARSITLA